MGWFTKTEPCDHDWEPVDGSGVQLLEILQGLMKEGYPVIAERTVRLQESVTDATDRITYDPHDIDIKIPGVHYLGEYNHASFKRVCMECEETEDQVEKVRNYWCDKICKAQEEETAFVHERSRRKKEATRIWEEKHGKS
jgi:hypothetical protein